MTHAKPPPPLADATGPTAECTDSVRKEKQAELLLDHYNDTFQHILYHWRVRNRLFMFILTLMTLIAVEINQPGLLGKWANSFIAKSTGLEIPSPGGVAMDYDGLGLDVIHSAMWFLLLCLVVGYYQRSVHVDRQYRYIEGVEKKLCDLARDPLFVTREGIAYWSQTGNPAAGGQRPILLGAIGLLYTAVFPSALILLIISRFSFSTSGGSFLSLNTLNILIVVLIFIYTSWYAVWALGPKRRKKALSLLTGTWAYCRAMRLYSPGPTQTRRRRRS